jgi:hypothetical protein
MMIIFFRYPRDCSHWLGAESQTVNQVYYN